MRKTTFSVGNLLRMSMLASGVFMGTYTKAQLAITLNNQSFTSRSLTSYFAPGTLSGTLTRVSVNVTGFTTPDGSTYSNDLCVYLGPETFTGGYLQAGGSEVLGASESYRWATSVMSI